MKKWDFLLLAVLLAATGILFWAFRMNSPEGGSVVVRVGGEEKEVYSLDKDQTVTIEGVNGGSNVLVIENGSAHFRDATCPDQLCVHQGEVSRQGESIICLPNQVIVEVKKGEESTYDAVAQ
jgi:hypothetical protein